MPEPRSVAPAGNGRYRLSKPIGVKVADLLHIDDVKVFASSERKLNRGLKETRGAMQDIGLHWNQKKCSVVHVKREAQVLGESGMRMDEKTNITALRKENITNSWGC